MTRGREGGPPVFEWTDQAEQAFVALKKAFLEDPILAYFDYDRETMIETDASDKVTACVAS